MANDPFEAALRALRHRDRTAAELDRWLAARGFEAPERRETLSALVRAGLVDDRRYAEARAQSLAQRGDGDARIEHDLGRAGIRAPLIADALAALEPEIVRARRVIEARGRSARTARYLAGKGFAEEVLAAIVAEGGGHELG